MSGRCFGGRSSRCLRHICQSLVGYEMHFLRDVINVRHETHFWLLPPLPLKGGFYESSFMAVHAVEDDTTPLKVTTRRLMSVNGCKETGRR